MTSNSMAYFNGGTVELRDGDLICDTSTDALVGDVIRRPTLRRAHSGAPIARFFRKIMSRHSLKTPLSISESDATLTYAEDVDYPLVACGGGESTGGGNVGVSSRHKSSVDSGHSTMGAHSVAATRFSDSSTVITADATPPVESVGSELKFPVAQSGDAGACSLTARRSFHCDCDYDACARHHHRLDKTPRASFMNGGGAKVAFEMRAPTASANLEPRAGGACTCVKKRRRGGDFCHYCDCSASGGAPIFVCTRTRLLLAALCALITVTLAVFLTYALTKEGVERHQRHAITIASSADGGDNNNLSDELSISTDITTETSFFSTQDDSFDMNAVRAAAADRAAKAAAVFDDEIDANDETAANLLADATDADVTATNVSSSTNNEPSAEELRLSENLAPIWYNLSMKIYVPGFVLLSEEKNLTFDANLTLKFYVQHATSVLELNALKLRFPDDARQILLTESPKTNSSDFTPAPALNVLRITVNETLEKVFFKLDRELVIGHEYLIQIPYSGPIAKKLSGLYITQYTMRDGRQRYAAVTQMEPTDARRVVPCFDEPAFKAVWSLSVMHPRGSRAVSNGIERRENAPTEEKDWLKTTFEPTLPMSSYLLALVVSEFEYVEGYTNKQTRFRIWARSDALNFTSYALQAGIKVLEFYEDYYGIPFPLPKQDMMAFPDFAAGAMENWGLVTYREKYLLYSADLYTLQQKLAVASVVSHELAHQWFGNLVTMKWWSDLWLNEGFATLMEYLGTDAISNGDFRMDEYFMVESLDSAFDRDARATSHPLFFTIKRVEDVSEAFDSITYSKGASVLRMIRAVMGEPYFRKGLNIYLNRYKYRNANYKNLWSTLTEAVPDTLRGAIAAQRFDVSDFARSWTKQMGYPVVEVRRDAVGRVVLSQQRFKLDQSAQEKAKFQDSIYGYKWTIPIWYNVNGKKKQLTWLTNDSKAIIEDVASSDLLIVNDDSNGFYRVQYGRSTLDAITRQLLADHVRISVKSRARIIDDTFTLAEAGRLPYTAALNLTRYLAAEREYLPWQMALNGLTVIQNYFGDEPEADYLRVYVKRLIGDLFAKQIESIFDEKFSDNSQFFENLLSLRVIQKMCSLRDLRCIDRITNLYRTKFVEPCARHINGNNKESNANNASVSPPMSSECSEVPVPLRSLTYCEGVHYGSERDFDAVMELYTSEAVQVERERLMMALACSRDTHTLKKLLAMASDINSTVIRLQDKPSVFSSISSRIIGQKVVVDFFIDHWPQLYKDFKEQQTLLRSIIANSIVGNSHRLIDEVEKFMKKNTKTTRNLDIFKQRLEVIKTNRKWIEHNFRSLSDWFKEQQK